MICIKHNYWKNKLTVTNENVNLMTWFSIIGIRLLLGCLKKTQLQRKHIYSIIIKHKYNVTYREPTA